MEYTECKVICNLKRKEIPLETLVPIDEFTNIASKNFDYEFDGVSKFYPYELPKEVKDLDFQILVVCGASGKGKSTLLKEFGLVGGGLVYDNNKAIISNFKTPQDAVEHLSAVGLSSIPVWCRTRSVLSVGEGFRADLALNIGSNNVFDEFTSTIDRNVAKSTCNSIQRFIRDKGYKNIVFCSCHKDYIPYLKPDIVIDLDVEKVFDCRGVELGEALRSKSMKQQVKRFGAYLGSITI